MFSQYIITLISAFVSYYLPFEDIATKVACSMAISQIAVIIGEKIFSVTSGKLNILKYFFPYNYVIIKHDNPFYDKFIELIYKKYIDKLSGCHLYVDFGNYKMMINELNSKCLDDKFTHDNKTHSIQINLDTITTGNQTGDTKNKNVEFKNIIISSKCSMQILDSYVQNLIKQCNEKSVNNLIIYKPNVIPGKKRTISWKRNVFKTNKTIKNTIVSENVNKYLFDDVKKFIENEEYYMKKGLAYKRGYLLHGEPGCGKTSIIKAIANGYDLPIFIVDLSIFENNNELTKLINDVNGFVANKQRHMLVFEDVDRTTVFSKNNGYYYEKKKITEDCILNIIDGLDESYGRIIVMTTNKLDVIKSMPALVRPGRIDATINVTVCTKQQICRILELYFDENYTERIDTFNDNIIITPAKLIQLISILNNDEKVIKLLNEVCDFTNFDVEKETDKIDENGGICEDTTIGKGKVSKDENKIPRYMSILKKKEKNLERHKKNLNNLEYDNSKINEKHNLLLERKKIIFRLCELDYEKYKNYCEALEEKRNNVSTDEHANNDNVSVMIKRVVVEEEAEAEDTYNSDEELSNTSQ